jgi:PAS domain S-box-containing protein
MQTTIDTQTLLGAIGDAVVICDTHGRVTEWNAAAERIFGFTAAEALGQRMDMIVPERLRKRHWDGYDKSMETGKTRYAHDLLRVPAVDKAGRAMSIAFTVFMLYDADGHVTACGSVIRDETERLFRGACPEEACGRAGSPVGRRQGRGLTVFCATGKQSAGNPTLHFRSISTWPRHSMESASSTSPTSSPDRPARSCSRGWART